MDTADHVVKHAGVHDATLEIARRRDVVVLTIRDRGCGFDTSRLAAPESHGFGLFSIRERVESLGGRFVLESRPGHGVLVAVNVPFPSASRLVRPGSRGPRQPARAAVR
jgi:signal transduction histidine kinase